VVLVDDGDEEDEHDGRVVELLRPLVTRFVLGVRHPQHEQDDACGDIYGLVLSMWMPMAEMKTLTMVMRRMMTTDISLRISVRLFSFPNL